MAPIEGLPGLDSSISFSSQPLDHLFIVIHGPGDPYVDHPPWMSSLENCLSFLTKNFNLVTENLQKSARHPSISSSIPSALFLPVEWHRPSFETWHSQIRIANPQLSSNFNSPTVRSAVAETLGDILLPASSFWKTSIALHLSKQIKQQIAAVKRNRPAFSGRVSIIAHSVGSILAVQLLQEQLIDISLDAIVFTGSPIAAYSALSPGEDQKTLATICQYRSSVRFFNVFHPLDPVAYRLEPFILKDDQVLQPAIQVKPRKRTFWDDATLFWDDVVFNLWSTLFQGNEFRPSQTTPSRSNQKTTGKGIVDLFSLFGGNQRGNASIDGHVRDDTNPNNTTNESIPTPERLKKTAELRRSSAYVITTPKRKKGSEMIGWGTTPEGSDVDTEEERKVEIEEDKQEVEDGNEEEMKAGGSEVLLSDRIDYELQDGMGVPPLDVMASWGAIKAHTYYWQSMDVAQMLVDIVVTCEDSMTKRGK